MYISTKIVLIDPNYLIVRQKKYTQIKIDENMINIITRIDIYMYMHVYTIVYSYLGKTLLKPVQF